MLCACYSRLGGDILAGFTVASLLVPQSISYALSLAKMNPVAGLVSSDLVHVVSRSCCALALSD